MLSRQLEIRAGAQEIDVGEDAVLRKLYYAF